MAQTTTIATRLRNAGKWLAIVGVGVSLLEVAVVGRSGVLWNLLFLIGVPLYLVGFAIQRLGSPKTSN